MDRRLIAGLLGLSCGFGCAYGRSGMPDVAQKEPIGVVDSLPSVNQVINKAAVPTDPATKRAKLDTSPMAPAEVSVPTPPTGRPAPFADRTAGAPRIQAQPTAGPSGNAAAQPRPAPYANQAPTAPRAQSSGSAAAPTPLPALPPPEPPPQAAADVPASTKVADRPPMAPPPPETPLPVSVATTLPALPPLLPAVETPPPVMVSAGTPSKDVAVVPTSGVRPAPKSKAKAPLPIGNGGWAAMVGNEVITLDQLRRLLKDQLSKVSPEQRSDPEFQKMIVTNLLEKLIERTLIVQALKKQIKDAKNLQSVYDSIDKSWTEHELPPLLRAENCANIHELKRKLAAQGKSLETIREDFRYDTLAHEFMLSKIQAKMHVSLPEKQQYYMTHLKEFDRPASVTWREIAIENEKCASRAEAQAKVTAILARLKKGEDFAKIAKAESHGATARDGGKWEIAPGGYAVPDINDALAALPIGQLSTIIEAPGGFHIVKVEAKRQAGPARFDEVQDEVKDKMLREKFAYLADEFIKNLRARTLVTTMFDPAPADPSAVRASGNSAAPPVGTNR